MSWRIPNLFLIGAMKSATSYLAGLLSEHPDVFVSDPPLFADVPERILSLNPEARFVYLLRDPVCRTISHYWHRVQHWGEERQMLDAISSDPEYTCTSNYALQLRSYLQHVNLERFFICTYQSLVADPRAQITALCLWLGVDADFLPRGLNTPCNVTPDVVIQRSRYTRLLMNNGVGAGAVGLLPRPVRRLASKFVNREVRPHQHPTADVETYLRSRQLEETEELSRILGRSFPEWTTLHAQNNLDSELRAALASQPLPPHT